ncbi:MAG: CRISPR-associated endonuclease Cas2 [Acidimicrobiia bacterium]
MGRRRLVVAYDIRDQVRLRKVHKAMKGFGYPMQYSVFICDLDRREKITLIETIGGLIHHNADSVVLLDLGDADGRGRECLEFLGAAHPLPVAGPQVF